MQAFNGAPDCEETDGLAILVQCVFPVWTAPHLGSALGLLQNVPLVYWREVASENALWGYRAYRHCNVRFESKCSTAGRAQAQLHVHCMGEPDAVMSQNGNKRRYGKNSTGLK